MTEVLISSNDIMHGAARPLEFSCPSQPEASASMAAQDEHFFVGLCNTTASENMYMLQSHESSQKKASAGQQHMGTQQNRKALQVRELNLPSSQTGCTTIGQTEGAPDCPNMSSWRSDKDVCTRSPTSANEMGSSPCNPTRRRTGAGYQCAEQNRGFSKAESNEVQAQLSLLALLLAAFRRSGLSCQSPQDEIKMEIGWPTNVQHVTHVTFDRYNGFLGLPVEFELEIPRRVPSASASVFGVSAESMQCSIDGNGNSVPTILLLMQERLYDQGGLKAEGIFRINPENSQEEHVRDQLNKGNVPTNIDVHCLAGLIKAWLRELPRGVLDALPPDQLLQCNTEEDCLALVKMLPPTQAALLNWAVNLMADVVQEEESNKMNARNVAMVFAPNMTQMSDPLTALMHAVQVMNFLKTLILKTLQDRRASVAEPNTVPALGLGLPNVSWQERLTPTTKIIRKGKASDKSLENVTTSLYRNVAERKNSMDHVDKCLVDVEERFLRGLRGRDTTDDLVNSSRIGLSSIHASVF